MKTVEIKKSGENFELKTFETRTSERVEVLSLDVIKGRLAELQNRRAMDALSFQDSLNKTDAEIVELSGLIAQAEKLKDLK